MAESDPPAAHQTILVADDEPGHLRLFERLLGARGYRVLAARDGQEALELVDREQPDLVLSDIRMPRVNGFDVCRTMQASPATRLIPVVLLTGAAEHDDRLRAIESGATDVLSKPVDQPQLWARVQSLLAIKRSLDDLDSAEAVLRTLAQMVEARDAYTQGHCERLSGLAVGLGRQLGLDDEALASLQRGGYFHDIGKIALPDSILLKPGPLTAAEYLRVQEHPVVGDRLCGDLRALQPVRPIVRHHHERLDGSGYPDRLRGDAIPLLAQITSIADLYDAMTSQRPYRDALAPAVALDTLRTESRRGWRRRDLVEAFAASVQDTAA